ncbi:hypothetical protein jhhlp_000569 [Lomentospora prolificans]|uniref:MARVEL domain-containing protein n=1 Tax=Lomentospora prolificans TaxID=41688 RepID=A0A2N3NLA6_9PEZI|nr:hypothetical protein jhhlp_000569 [Lomentospora prolificans]
MSIFSLGASYLAFSALHFVLFILAIITAALHGADLANGEASEGGGDSRWIFAEVVAGLSALTAMLYLIPCILRFMAVWIWNLILFILWISLFGLFAKVRHTPFFCPKATRCMYIHRPTNGNGAVRRMKAAVWVDLVSAILWLVATLAALAYWWGHRERRSRFTGRATLY